MATRPLLVSVSTWLYSPESASSSPSRDWITAVRSSAAHSSVFAVADSLA